MNFLRKRKILASQNCLTMLLLGKLFELSDTESLLVISDLHIGEEMEKRGETAHYSAKSLLTYLKQTKDD